MSYLVSVVVSAGSFEFLYNAWCNSRVLIGLEEFVI